MEKEEFLEMVVEKLVEFLEQLSEDVKKLQVDVDKLIENNK